MSKAIIISIKQWNKILDAIAKTTPRSAFLIRNGMKETLGFTVRYHTEWVDRDEGYGTKYRQETIHLDFYNEPKKTMFLLKYSDIIGKTNT